MIDTLMALWNRGYGGRGIIVSIVFFVICISISLLLITVQGPWAAGINHSKDTANQATQNTGAFTPTSQSNGIQPIADNTVTINDPTSTPTQAPTPKPTSVLCTATPAVGHTPTALTYRPTNTPKTATPTHSRPTPTPTPRPTSTPAATATASPTATSTPTLTPSPTASSTPSPTPTATSTPAVTPTSTPSPTSTGSPTPTGTITPTATASPAATITPTATSTPGIIPTATVTLTSLNRQRTLCSQNSAGFSLGLTGNGQILALLWHDLGFILGGSMLGTTLFYLSLFWVAQKKKISG